MYVAGDVCELENEKYIAWQMVVSLQQRVQKINSDIQTLGDKIKADEYLHLSDGEDHHGEAVLEGESSHGAPLPPSVSWPHPGTAGC